MLGAGSLGRSSMVYSVLCVRFRSSVETNKATADTRCTEPPHGSSSTPCDRLGRAGSALYRIREWRSGEVSHSHLQKCWCCGSVFHVLCERPPGQHAGRAPSPKEESRVGGGALLLTSTSWVLSWLVVASAMRATTRRATTTSRPPPWVATCAQELFQCVCFVQVVWGRALLFGSQKEGSCLVFAL